MRERRAQALATDEITNPCSYSSRSPSKESCDKRGIALVSTMALLVSIVALGFALGLLTESVVRLNRIVESDAAAYNACMAGLEEARGRLNPSAPDGISTAMLPQTVNDVVYLVNGSIQDPVDPTNLSSPYFDHKYGEELPGGFSAANLLGTVPSDQPGAGTTFVIPFKWVRITLKTEYSSRQDVNYDGHLDSTTPIYWDGLHQDLVSNVAGGVPVFKLTALAVVPPRVRKIVQAEIAGTPPIMPAGSVAAATSANLSATLQIGPGRGRGGGRGRGRGGGPPGLGDLTNLIVTGIDTCSVGSVPGIASGGTISTSGSVTMDGSPVATSPGLTPFPHSASSLIAAWRRYAALILNADPAHVVVSALDGSYLGTDVVLGRGPTATQPIQPLIVFADRPLTISSTAAEGAGILMVQGDLAITGGFTYYGLIVVDGNVTVASDVNGSISIQGSLISSGTVSADSTGSELTSLNISYDSCSLTESFRILPKTVRSFREISF